MYRNPHGIMFHHFYDERHCAGQGAISSDQLAEMIEYLGRSRILSANEWSERARHGTLEETDICFTFDDTLLCQYDIALPVLQDYSMTAFWFVCSSVISGGIVMSEVYRKFRTTIFENIEDFYVAFSKVIEDSEYAKLVASTLESFVPEDYLSDSPFYTKSDREFRYIRDKILGQYRYDQVMAFMLNRYGIDVEKFAGDLWMREDQLKQLDRQGHIVGLHSHRHPTNLAALPESQQRAEYEDNFRIVEGILGRPPTAMSHPYNSYSQTTLLILRELGIRLGFRANTAKPILSELEYPREDHANIIKEMGK